MTEPYGSLRNQLRDMAILAFNEHMLVEKLAELRIQRDAASKAFKPMLAQLPDNGVEFRFTEAHFRVMRGWNGEPCVIVERPPHLDELDLTAMELATDSEPTDEEVEELKTELRHIYSPSVEDLVDAINPIDQEVS